MKAEIKKVHSPDVEDLKSFCPTEEDNFGFLLQLFVGVVGQKGEESFDIEVCTPKWLLKRKRHEQFIVGRHYLIVFNYNFIELLNFLSHYIQNCKADSWEEIALKIGRIAKWEFEDYAGSKQLTDKEKNL